MLKNLQVGELEQLIIRLHTWIHINVIKPPLYTTIEVDIKCTTRATEISKFQTFMTRDARVSCIIQRNYVDKWGGKLSVFDPCQQNMEKQRFIVYINEEDLFGKLL